MLGCQVSTIPHKRRFIDSIRHQLMAQLFVSGVDKSSCCFVMMAAKCIVFTSLFTLLEAGPTIYWCLRNSESIGAGPFLPKKINRQQDAIASSWQTVVEWQLRWHIKCRTLDFRIATLKIASCVPAGAR